AAEDALHAADEDFCMVAVLRAVDGLKQAGSAIINAEKADLPAADFAGEAKTILRIDDATREQQSFRSSEIIRVLQKEWPLFREEDFVTLVGGDLRLVRFNLAEVGIHSCIKGKRVMNDDFCVDAAAIDRLRLDGRRSCCGIEEFFAAGIHIGRELHIA